MNVDLFIVSVFIIAIVGIIIAGFLTHNHIDFLNYRSVLSLLCLTIASLLTWLALILIENSEGKFNIKRRQWVSFAISVSVGILTWIRYVYVNDN